VKKKVPVVRVAEPFVAGELEGLPAETVVALADVGAAIREGLLAFSASVGLVVMRQLMEAELTARIGPKHAKLPGRAANWHGATAGSVTLGGRAVRVERPRGRTVDGEEIELASWAVFSSRDLLCQLVVERMIAGVATRRHGDVAEPVGAALEARSRGGSKSAVSRRFVKATQAALEELLARRLDDLAPAVVMVDGLEVAGRCVVVALVITAEGTKVPVGLWDGDTENKTVVTALLADLVERGLRFEDGLLVVLDGAKALAGAVRKVFGQAALVQRCTLHKRRNVAAHLPKERRKNVDWRLARAFASPDWTEGLARAKALAAELDADYPSAAASLREGLEDMFTVRRLGISGRLAVTLTNTNCIESMISVARTLMERVKNWEDTRMVRRWTGTGMLEAQRSFRRVKGHHAMPDLVSALRRHARPTEPAAGVEAAA
jgi:putative transposase